MIEVIQAGLFTTVQDLGRYGWRQLGFARSGAMDPLAASAANLLLDQDVNMPLLECTLLGPTLKFHCDSAIVLTGATMTVKVDGNLHQPGQTIAIKAGQTVVIGRAAHGCRSYLAIKGGISTPDVLGSVSYQSHVGLGLQLQRDNRLSITPYTGPVADCHSWVGLTWPLTPVLAVFASAHTDQLQDGIEALSTQPWQLSQHANRIGLRLSGQPLNHSRLNDMPSEPVLPGTVQLPPNGLPLILGADSQSTGGYPKVAQVCESSLTTLAQLRPNQELWFEPISLEEAKLRQRRQQRHLKILRQAAHAKWLQ
ncbi:biotin-dependent carboxyltransferase family protein [Ferrimonas lipolytica]|uniref:Biotin-dependent carboxyltransferase family protein n=1 Tax=Ferrimonas lipolytica TaxID=2724191 RepID=A0A6H1UFZ3_9GAMM|nr:biotin-dependent carboxyltransferase family protein [Ferrimonas lipolytica]QIZ77136.1 biotin-dependent carboxyltransferase family protein [Ferrimonas lipolytica]